MVQANFETGMYVIDKDFRIVNINAPMSSLYPNVGVGDFCYRSIAMQECQCEVCPLKTDNALFYNPVRKEWIHANATVMDYPGCGECYTVQFQIHKNSVEVQTELLQAEELEEAIRELSGGSLDVCVIGGYCAPGSPLAYANSRMLQLLGYQNMEDLQQGVDGLVSNTIHPDDLERVTMDLTNCAQYGGTFETSYRIYNKDHSWTPIVARGTRVQTSSGEYVLLCVITELNEFLKRQNALQRENEALIQQGMAAREAMEHIPSGYHRCAAAEGYPFLFVSKSFEQVVGYTWEQIQQELDNKFINLVIPEDLPRFYQMEATLSDCGNADLAYRIRRRDGQIRWVQDSTMAIDWDGVPAFQCTIADITDFVDQQAEFARQRTQFDMIAENIPCGYHRCTVDNGFRLEFVSESFLQTVGYEREEVLGKPYLDLVVPEDRNLFMSHEPALARDGKIELVYRIRRKDGTIRWLKDSTMRIEYNGKGSYQCILADITEHVEGLNEAKAKAEASSQVKSVFLFNASHDIRTPMNAIQGFARIIEDNADNPAIVRETVAKLMRSGDVLLTLLNDVLELSRIEQGKETVNIRPLDMLDHTEKLHEMMVMEMADCGIDFRMENNVQHPLVMADDLKLTRIAMNFLSNAKKFTHAGGTVTFGVTESDYDGTNAVYSLVVEDTGIGMSEEFQKRAFEQFEREQSSTNSGVSGSGLGLAITKKIADLVGGTCTIESQLGKGTRITCAVPLALTQPEAFQQEASDTALDFSDKRVLLVEDNDFNREIARYIFEGMGFQVEDAVNGVACIEKLTAAPAGHFDYVFMDVQMPVMDGYTATKEIRRFHDPRLAQIPIIAMTANAFEEDRKICLSVGMDGHISKPMDTKAVLKELTWVLTK